MEEYKRKKMTKELLDTIDSGKMNGESISRFTYEYMAALLESAQKLEDGKALYRQTKTYLDKINIERLQAQVRAKKKIIVGFITNCASVWIGDALYNFLDSSECFEPYVFVMANYVNGESMEETKKEYQENVRYFKERNLKVVPTFDTVAEVSYTWEEIKIRPQLCIWLTPWSNLFDRQFQLMTFPMDIIHTYIPYGFMLADNQKGDMLRDQYNKLLHNVAWKIFEDSKLSVEMAKKYSFNGGMSAVYTGSPKMDGFYERHEKKDSIWDALIERTGNDKAKKIIYAPHHTIEDWELIHFSTFASNYMFMLDMAEKYQKDTVWVFKPHPQLKYKAVKAGIFNNMEEWYEYEQRWKSLENADVMYEGEYHDLFLESDAIILDSVSFLAEYLYVHKPLLMLRGESQFFNDSGKKLMQIHYCAEGADMEAIEHFLVDVVLAEHDLGREKREQFFDRELNYKKITGQTAAANIFEQLEAGLLQ
ncbi:MAG: CDP-glycerol glycerophosphotransferase family protein [Ruminococcus flavefaciens]|nr:CDP-glycerol glycerophosphotransferase family protein [Ruminococcus flavefaciens]